MSKLADWTQRSHCFSRICVLFWKSYLNDVLKIVFSLLFLFPICQNCDDDGASSSDDEFGEFITLGKSSKFVAWKKWRFPDTDNCPLYDCHLAFSSREFALLHFRMNHSETAMMCTQCKIPFSAEFLEEHYHIYHPNATLPAMKTVSEWTKTKCDVDTDNVAISSCWIDDDNRRLYGGKLLWWHRWLHEWPWPWNGEWRSRWRYERWWYRRQRK